MKLIRRSPDLHNESLFYKDLVRASSGTHGARNTRVRYRVPGTVCGYTVASGGQPAGKEHRSPRPPTDHRLMSSAKEDDGKRQQKGKKKDRGRSVAWPHRGGDAAGRGRSGAEMQRGAAEAERG